MHGGSGTAEIEDALVSHEAVAEAAVTGYPHETKGESVYAFITLNTGIEKADDLKKHSPHMSERGWGLLRPRRKSSGLTNSPRRGVEKLCGGY